MIAVRPTPITVLDWSGNPISGTEIDLVPRPGERPSLEAIAVASLLTWRRADPDDPIPEGSPRYGHWSFTVDPDKRVSYGSRLYLLATAVLTDETLERFREYVAEAFAWWTVEKLAARVTVRVQRLGRDAAAATVEITEPNGRATVLRFPHLWQEVRANA